ncbi:MAG: aminotransferase class IV [Bacteroidales bacterium]|nr:aminotransferase class IV [Bacteroidales bacterium]
MVIQGSQIDFNGKYQPSNTLDINIFNRAMLYGDCVFEQIRTNASTMLFFGRHLDKLCAAMTFMNMPIPDKFSSQRTVLKEELTKLLIKNKIFKGGMLTLMVMRTGGVLDLPDVIYIATVQHMPSVLFDLNKEGFMISIFNEIPMPAGRIANYNTYAASMVKNLAYQFARKSRTNDACIVNAQGDIVGGARSGNIFCVRDSEIFTPPLSAGCADSVMRRHVLDIAEILDIKANTETLITPDFMQVADEIFFASTEYGISWAMGWQNRRYYRRTAEMVFNRLNQFYADEF